MTNFNQNFLKYWLPVIFWMGFIFWMSTETFSSMNTSWSLKTILRFLALEIPSAVVDMIHTYIRKAAHFTEYFILSLLLFRAIRGGSRASLDWRWVFFATSVGVLWAAGDEAHQMFAPSRTASLVDVGIDMAGGMLGQLVCALFGIFIGRNRSVMVFKKFRVY